MRKKQEKKQTQAAGNLCSAPGKGGPAALTALGKLGAGWCWRQGLILLLPALRPVLVSGWSCLWVCPTARPGPRCHRASAPNTVSATGNTHGLSSLMCHCDNREGS